MSSGILKHRRKAFRSTGGNPFIEIPDSDAGKMIQNALTGSLQWGTPASWTTWTNWDTEDSRDTDIFDAESSGSVNIKADGLYLIMFHGLLFRLGGSNRSSAEARLEINGSPVPVETSLFIRRSDGHDYDSKMSYAILRLSNTDDVSFAVKENDGTGTQSDAYFSQHVSPYSSFTIIRLNENNPYMMLSCSGTGADHQLTADDTDQDVEFNVQDEIDTDYFAHSTSVNPDEITIKYPGKYLVAYSDVWERLTDNATRTGVYERLQLNGSNVAGSWSNCYIRGSQNSESITFGSNAAMTLIETTTTDQVLKLVAAREAGAITNERKSTRSSIMLYQLHGNEETFSIGSSSTENLGSTTGLVPDFSTTDWIDSNFSLSSDEITVTGAKDMLIGGGVHTDGGSTIRVATKWTLRLESVENARFGSAGYSRVDGTMARQSPNVAGVISAADSETIGLYNISYAGNESSACQRVANSGRFWGIDLGTL